MPQLKTIFTCSKCDAQSPKWSGRCLECGEWGGLTEQALSKNQNAKCKMQNFGVASPHYNNFSSAKVQNLGTLESKNVPRLKSGINELDKVLGGGVVPGALILLGGEPGIGKSTLLLQLAASLHKRDPKNPNTSELSEEKIIEKDLSYKLTGIFFEVQQELGRFCREKQYADALAKKLSDSGLEFKRECPIEINDIKSNFADFIIENKILVELKTKNFIEKNDYNQVLRYLENSDLELGLLVNFKQQHLKPKRILNYKRFNEQKKPLGSFGCNSDISDRGILYVSGEESAEQLKTRLDRLRLGANNLQYLGETSAESVCGTITHLRPTLAIVDSIQMLRSEESGSDPGSTSQIKISTSLLAQTARETNIPIIIVGHVTKDGALAGPKTLEHLVDVVLEFSGDRASELRILRAIKNRFGSAGELAFFEMTSGGLAQVADPSKAMLVGKTDAPGSIVGIALEGSRPLAVEMQALVNRTSFGYPKRQAVGFDLNKLQLLAAVLSKRTGANLNFFDTHLKIVGGFKVTEPGTDLPVALALISALRNKSVPVDTVAIGEVGLAGEIRPVAQLEKRLKEAERLGFKSAIVPKCNIKSLKIKLLQVKNIGEALDIL